MKIAIKDINNLTLRMAVLLRRLVSENEDELLLFATPDVAEKLKSLLQKNTSINEIYASDKTIYIAKGLKIQIEEIDGFE